MEALQMCQSTTPTLSMAQPGDLGMQGSREAEAEDAYAGVPHLPAKPEASTQIFSPSPWL